MRVPPIIALVPMKPLSQAKTRLLPLLGPVGRDALVLRLLERVLRAMAGEPGIHGVWVLGGDGPIRAIAQGWGASFVEDEGRGLNEALTKGFRLCRSAGASPLFVPGDLPLLTAQDVGLLLTVSRCGRTLALSPALRDGGTNALVVPEAVPFLPQFGEGSFRRHLAQADSLATPVTILVSPGLALDLDTPEDLETLATLGEVPL